MRKTSSQLNLELDVSLFDKVKKPHFTLATSATQFETRNDGILPAAVRAVGAVGAVCVLGAGAAVVAEGVGVVETCPLATPPEGNAKRSLSTPPSHDDGGVGHHLGLSRWWLESPPR
jgi:hypothetical protein